MAKPSKPQVIQIDTSARGRTFRLAETLVENHGQTVRARGLGDTMIELAERAGAYRGRVEMEVRGGHYQPLGKTTMRRLVDRATRRRGAEFATLATHYGVVE